MNLMIFTNNSIFEIFHTKIDLKMSKKIFLWTTRRALSNHAKKMAKKNFVEISTCRHLMYNEVFIISLTNKLSIRMKASYNNGLS